MRRNYLIVFLVAVHGLFALHTNVLANPDNVPLGRMPSVTVGGQYPASYFPDTERAGADEMRITALGTGMPNQTKAVVSISCLVEQGNGDKPLFDLVYRRRKVEGLHATTDAEKAVRYGGHPH